ncbi:MAG TPA: hypothetical protein VM842_10395, partial [Nitrospira sp.]|nr:hypothetical protein [Nitrospira sp.]
MEPIAIKTMAKAILIGKAVQQAGHRIFSPNLYDDIVSRPVMCPKPSAYSRNSRLMMAATVKITMLAMT